MKKLRLRRISKVTKCCISKWDDLNSAHLIARPLLLPICIKAPLQGRLLHGALLGMIPLKEICHVSGISIDN